jgi:DNA-binding response OmpR family regulator
MPNSPLDGLELLVYLRNHYPIMDLIMLTGFATLDTSIAALRQGAYDYLIKPVSIHQVTEVVQSCMTKRKEANDRQQLISQIETMLKQLKGESAEAETIVQQPGRIVETPDLFIDRKKRLVVHRGRPVELTATEFDMLDYLATHSDRVVTARELVRAVQGYDIDEVDARPIARVNVRRLRQKLEDDPNNPQYIITVRTRGYRFTG